MMTKPKVYVLNSIPREAEEYISQYCDVEKWDSSDPIPREELLQKISDAEGLLLVGTKIDDELLEHAPKLRVVSNISVGYNNFDLEAMKNRGVIGTNTPYVLDDTVADLIFGLILSSARRICELDSYVKGGKWNKDDKENLFGIDVHHSTLGIIGMGRIGEAVAKRARFGFDMNVLYHNRNRKLQVEEKLGAEYRDMDSLLRESDFVLLMTPLSKDTNNLISYDQFSMMKETAFFINASRGQTVNEDALVNALENKQIRGAGLDVYVNEPINPDHPLLKLSNAVTLPHLGSATHKTRFDMAMKAAESLVEALTTGDSPSIVPELRKDL
jgi:glyoxylate/hydroxypyruvate/2-ketogluconate reductase